MSRPPLRRNTGPSISRVGAVLILLAGIWGAGLFRFADAIPTGVQEPDRATDAIVVLTGGSGRLDEGLALLEKDAAEKLFISGVYKGVDVLSLLEAYGDKPEALRRKIGIGHAEDTIDNALETGAWAKENGVSSIRLVTSAYHMPRALLEFENAAQGLELVAHPVFPAHVKQEDWWAWPGTTGLIVGEYNKFLIAWVRHRVMDLLN